ncbi:MAG: hypothetical protein QM820_14600 [Minicystis sp.]
MSRMRAPSWEIEALDPAWDASAPQRAKPVVRCVAARWDEREGALCTMIGCWSVQVRRRTAADWEWSAFSLDAPRALRCTGFPDPKAAQNDAEHSLARVD